MVRPLVVYLDVLGRSCGDFARSSGAGIGVAVPFLVASSLYTLWCSFGCSQMRCIPPHKLGRYSCIGGSEVSDVSMSGCAAAELMAVFL